ncbi:MAG TPA: hypothetical protein VJ734_00225 [Nitrosospira sp.]|nr:hypothetical protein [Nitrosospira sp.]
MALWMTALKIIPWGSVVESAPHIVKAAKHIFYATKRNASDSPVAPDWGTSDVPVSLDKRVRLLEAKIVELSDEQRSLAELVKSLAEQNAVMVEAIDVFRVRVKILLVAFVLLAGGLGGVLFWLSTT